MSTAEELNPLEMSDDDINDAIARELARVSGVNEEEEADDIVEDVADTEEVEETEEVEDVVDEDTEVESEDDSETVSEDAEDEVVEDTDDDLPEAEDDSEEPTEASDDEEVESDEEIDYKTLYEQVLAPFKANGKEMQVDNIDDVRSLMQMGANYSKKMMALKPNLKIMKMLENNGLLDESKLTFLIDLDKKEPEAIKKLIGDSGIDPLDLDTTANSYKPNTYTVSDKEVELDGILEEIRDTETFNATLDVIGNKWDSPSKNIIVNDPSIIRTINEHMQTGIYDIVSQAVERERVLGRLNGLSDLEAYKQIGDMINDNGGFAHLQHNARKQQAQPKVISKPSNVNRAKTTVDPKLTNRKKAASSTKSAPSTKREENFNPLSLSDEEFEKLVASKFV